MPVKVKEVITTIVLVLIIIITTICGFNMLSSKKQERDSAAIQAAKDKGKASVTIDKLNVFDEVPMEVEDGDTFKIYGTDVKIKVSGKLTDSSMESYGYYNYSSADGNYSEQFNYELRKNNISQFHNALAGYWRDDPSVLLDFYGIVYEDMDIEYYQQTYKDGNIPIIYHVTNDIWYMFIDCDDYFIVANAHEPFIISDEKVSVHYGDPNADPMYSHTYSQYESLAAENTRNELLDNDDGYSSDNPYQSDDVIGTADTYTSTSDNAIRKQMVSYANYTWDANGQSTETSLRIDFTSEEAKKSEWKLTSTTYSYEYAALKVSMLSGKRDSTTFNVTGNINNTLDTERPFVIVVKFISSEGNLLGIKVLDNRQSPIKPNGVTTFSVTLNTAKDKVEIDKIAAVQFEVY